MTGKELLAVWDRATEHINAYYLVEPHRLFGEKVYQELILVLSRHDMNSPRLVAFGF